MDTIRNPAQKIETDAFNMATSHDDYIKRVAAQIFKIKESYEKEQQSSTTVDQAFDAHGSSNSSALQADGNSYSNSTTTAISKHTDNDYVASAGVDRSTHDIYNPTIHTEANESHADTAIMEIDEAASNDNTKSQVRISL